MSRRHRTDARLKRIAAIVLALSTAAWGMLTLYSLMRLEALPEVLPYSVGLLTVMVVAFILALPKRLS